MRVNHGRGDVFMPEQFLNGANIITILKQMRRPRKSAATFVRLRLRGRAEGVFLEIMRQLLHQKFSTGSALEKYFSPLGVGGLQVGFVIN